MLVRVRLLDQNRAQTKNISWPLDHPQMRFTNALWVSLTHFFSISNAPWITPRHVSSLLTHPDTYVHHSLDLAAIPLFPQRHRLLQRHFSPTGQNFTEELAIIRGCNTKNSFIIRKYCNLNFKFGRGWEEETERQKKILREGQGTSSSISI